MEVMTTVAALGATVQDPRLASHRRFAQAGTDGPPAGEVTNRRGGAAATRRFNLTRLERTGLARAQRAGRSGSHAADCDAMRARPGYLSETCCCCGQADACGVEACRPPASAAAANER